MKTTLNPNNENHWTSHNALIAEGAPAPLPSSPLWNDWAANNPTARTLALRKVNLANSGLLSKTGILGSAARPMP